LHEFSGTIFRIRTDHRTEPNCSVKPTPNQGQKFDLFPIILYSELRKGKRRHVGSV